MKKLVTLVILLAVLSSFGLTASAQEESWWETAAAPYAGVTLHGISESTPRPITLLMSWLPSSRN